MENQLRPAKLVLISGFLFAITGCVPDSAKLGLEAGRYTGYRDLLVAIGHQAKFPAGTPQSVKDRYAECAADFVWANTSPADKPKLDAYARGQRDLTVGELKRMDRDLAARAGGPLTEGGLERLTPYCPDDVPSFLRYPPHS